MKYPEDFINQIICGDCMEVMKEIPDNSIDTIITDPPYGLEFMGKDWDRFKENEEFQKWNYLWAKEALRVAKPGATLLCFGGSRTFHRLACAIEDSGWIIKDCIMWIYGSGFPKATDISKQIDKKAGEERKVIGISQSEGGRSGETSTIGQYLINYGKNIPITEPATPEAQLWNGWKSHSLKPAYESIIVAMKPNDGSYVENALKWGVAGLNIDEARIGTEIMVEAWAKPSGSGCYNWNKEKGERKKPENPQQHQDRFPANIILSEEAAQELDRQSGNKCGQLAPTTGNEPSTLKKGNVYGDYSGYGKESQPKDKLGGASRFFKVINDDEDDFPRFIYCAKASRSERNMGCEEFYILKEDTPSNIKEEIEKYLISTKTNGIIKE